LNTSERNASPLIEIHTIGYVPPEDRHGKVRDLFGKPVMTAGVLPHRSGGTGVQWRRQ
jgi:hypothetical protein